MKTSPYQKLPLDEAPLDEVRVIAKYPVRILHFTELGVLLGGLLAMGIHSWMGQQQHWDRIVWDDVRTPDPTPAQAPFSPASPGDGENPDRDNDGIPDDWETQFYHNPDNATDAGADFDNDGLTALQEFELYRQTAGLAGNPLGTWRVETFPQPVTEHGGWAWPVDINNQGLILVQTSTFNGSDSVDLAYLIDEANEWIPIVSEQREDPGYCWPSDLTDDGTVVGAWYPIDWSTGEPFVWSREQGYITSTLNGKKAWISRINNHGDWVGSLEDPDDGSWTPAYVVDGLNLHAAEDWWPSVYYADVNDYGLSMGQYFSANSGSHHTFLAYAGWTFDTGLPGAPPFFDDSMNLWLWSSALNAHGEFTGGATIYRDNTWTQAGYHFDGAYNKIRSPLSEEAVLYPYSLNAAGTVVGYSYFPGAYQTGGFLYRDGVCVLLKDVIPELNSHYASRINEKGQFVTVSMDATTINRVTPDQDQDGDGMSDDWEEFYGLDKNDPADAFADQDDDGTNNRGEFLLRSDPNAAPVLDPNGEPIDLRPGIDTDGDGIPNAWEWANGLNYEDPADAVIDFDRDGYTNLQEFRLDTDPRGAPSYRVRQIGPFNGVSTIFMNSATLGEASVAAAGAYAHGEQITEQVHLGASPTSGGTRPALWAQSRTEDSGQLSFYPTGSSVSMNILARSPSGAVLTSHGSNPVLFTYWASPTATPVRLSGEATAHDIRQISSVTFSPLGNYLFAIRYKSSNGSREPIVWKMPSSVSVTYKPVPLTAPAGASLDYWMNAFVNDHGIIAANGTVSGQTRAILWTLNAEATSTQGSILPNLVANGFTNTIGLSNHSNPVIAGNAMSTGNQQRAIVWKYNGPASFTAVNLGTLPNGNFSNLAKISPNGTLAGVSNTLSANTLKRQIFCSYPVIPDDADGIDSALYRIMPQGEPSIANPTITHVNNAGEIIATLPVANSQPVRSLLRHGKSYPLDSILPVSSGYALDTIKSINSHGTLLVTAWNENSLETLLLTPDRDADGDGLPDAYENIHQFNAYAKNNPAADSDADGLSDLLEFANATNPRNPDSDSDGMKDGWEVEWGFLPLDPADALLDPDEDRVTNLRESQIGTIPTGIYKVEVVHTDTAGDNPQILATGDDGTIVRTGSVSYNDLSTESVYGSEWVQEIHATLYPSSELILPSNKDRSFYNDDGSYFRNAGEYGNYYFDATSQQIHGHRYHFDYGYDTNTGEYFSGDTFHLTPDITNHPDESDWITWDQVVQNLHNPDLHDGFPVLEPWDYLYDNDSVVSASGIRRLHRSGSGQQLLLNERGEFVDLLPGDHYWQKINDHGIAACYEAWYHPDYNSHIPWLFLSSGEVLPLPFQADSSYYPDYEILALSNDGKLLIRHGYLNQQPQWVNRYFLYDINTLELRPVRLPALGNNQDIKLSNNNGRLLLIGDKSRVVTPDGTSIRLDALRIHDGTNTIPLKNLYPLALNPSQISSDGRITLTTTNNLGQQIILQVIKHNDTNNDGLPDDWQQAFNISDPFADDDGDGLPNQVEYEIETDPNNWDTDGDGISDYDENLHGKDPLNPNDVSSDEDGDGLSNHEEQELGTDPLAQNVIGPINLGFDETITDFPDLSFREENPSDLFDQSSISGWSADSGSHIEVWRKENESPYVELQSHWHAHGVKQTFQLLPKGKCNFILRYKGRYDGFVYENAFKLKIAGADKVELDGIAISKENGEHVKAFMEDDESDKYADWKNVVVSITAPSDRNSLKDITLSLVPVNPSYGNEHCTYGGFVDFMPVEVVDLSPKLKGVDGKEIVNSGKPVTLPKTNELIEEIKLKDQVDQNRIAHREMKVKIQGGKILAGKKVTWTMKAWGVKETDDVRGDWKHSKVNEHKNRFEKSMTYGKYGYEPIDQKSCMTSIEAVGDDGYSAIRVNLPPIGWNHAEIKMKIEETEAEIPIIRFVVAAVVVLDAGHGGDKNIDDASLGNSTANNAKGGYWDPNRNDKNYALVKSYSGASGVLEKDITLSYAKELEKQLKTEHKKVDLPLRIYQTRTEDKNKGGYIRAQVARDKGADIFLSLHFNSAAGPDNLAKSARGTLVTTRLKNNSNVNYAEDVSFEKRIVAPVNAALFAIDGIPRTHTSPHKSGNAVTSDVAGYYQDNEYHPIRSTLLEIDFVHNESGDKLINGDNKEIAKRDSMKALAGAIIEELTVFKVQNDK